MKIALGWRCTNLGALLAQPQKNNDVQCLPSLPLPVSAGRLSYRQTYIKQGCRKTLMSKEYTYACFGGQAFQGQTRNLNQSHLRRGKQGWGREKALNLFVSAPLTNCNVATCWHVELSTAQLPSLNLVNRMCLSNSDFDVQSVGYKSAQSPTNWESIHGKDPSILCWLSSRLSMALSNENPKGRNPRLCIDKKKLVIIMFMQCMWNLENWPSIHYKYNFGVTEAPVCLKSKYKMFQPDLDVCVNFTCVRRHHHMSNDNHLVSGFVYWNVPTI